MMEATRELLEWHEARFCKLSYVWQSLLAYIFHIFFATKSLVLIFKNEEGIQKFPLI